VVESCGPGCLLYVPHRTRLLPALAVAAAVLSLAGAGTASADTSHPAGTAANVVTFGIQPAGLGVVDGRGYFTYSATPGAHLSDHAAILNYSDKPLTLSVAVTDAVSTSTGGFALLTDDQQAKDVGTWISFPAAMRTITVPARTTAKAGERDVPLSVVIPTNASPGDHVGGITVSLQSLAKSPNGSTYKLVQRVGARVFVRVSGPLRPQLTIEKLAAAYGGTLNPFGRGRVTVTYVVHNTGNVALGGAQSVQVSGMFGGTRNATAVAQIPLLLPGFSIPVTVVVPGVFPSFRESATVSISPLKVAGSVLPPAGPWTASTSFWAIPWPLLLLLLLLVLVIVVFEWRMRRRTPGPAVSAPPSAPAPVRTPQGASR
jgi:Bacterial protein of unknown function (DUF916)